MKTMMVGDAFAYLTIRPCEGSTGRDNNDSYLVEVFTDQAMVVGTKETRAIRFTVNGSQEMREMCRAFGNAGRRMDRA